MDNPKIFSKGYYDRLYEVEERHWWCRGMRRIAEALLKKRGPSGVSWTALDAGCGTGITLRWLREQGFATRTFGIDFSEHALLACASRAEQNLCRASVLELPFPEQFFDLVTCFDVLQHLPIPGGDISALREIHRILRPGGLLLIRSNARRLSDTGDSAQEDYRRYTLPQLQQLFKEAGFTIERLTYVNCLDAVRERIAHALSLSRKKNTGRDSSMDQGLPLRLSPWYLRVVDWILYSGLQIEAWALKSLRRSHGIGHSTYALVRKPAAISESNNKF